MEDRNLHEKLQGGRKVVALPPRQYSSPVPPKKVKGNAKAKKGLPPDHVYSSLDLHHIHDVHVDSHALEHAGYSESAAKGILSGETAGDGFEDFERKAMGKLGWGGHVRKAEWGEEEFNLDTYQLKRLQQIMDRVRVRKKQSSAMANLFRAEDRRRYKMEQLQALIVEADESFRVERIIKSRCSDPMRFTCTGDEYRLRQELEVYGKKSVNVRDVRMGGRTLLHEAVGRGYLHIVRMLLSDFQANPNIATLLGWTSPLHLAVEKNYRQIAAYLIAFGANLKATDSYGRVPFHLVKSIGMMKLLLKYTDLFNPYTTTTEGLLPSQHYAKYCPEVEKIGPLEVMLQRAEDRGRSEEATRLRLEQQAVFDRAQGIVQDFPYVISENSSVVDSKDPLLRTKNAYHYKLAAAEPPASKPPKDAKERR